jgi:hypothetical protein
MEEDEKVISFQPRKPTIIGFVDESREFVYNELIFDAVVEDVHESEIEVTENPVEFGANISDHAFVLPRRVSVAGRISDISFRDRPDDPLASSITDENSTRSADAWALLNQIKDRRQPVYIDTHLQTYENMLLVSLKTTQDAERARVLDVEMEFKEIFVVQAPESEFSAQEPGPVEITISHEITPRQEVNDWEQSLVPQNTSRAIFRIPLP